MDQMIFLRSLSWDIPFMTNKKSPPPLPPPQKKEEKTAKLPNPTNKNNRQNVLIALPRIAKVKGESIILFGPAVHNYACSSDFSYFLCTVGAIVIYQRVHCCTTACYLSVLRTVRVVIPPKSSGSVGASSHATVIQLWICVSGAFAMVTGWTTTVQKHLL